MTRYYYDCPIQAAYMAKYHGMTFDVGFPSGGSIENVGEKQMQEQAPNAWTRAYFYLTPESETLILPKVGDLVKATYRSGEFFVYRHVTSVDSGVFDVGGMKSDYGFLSPIGNGIRWIEKIITRNNVAFIWPKRCSGGGND